MKPFQFNIYLGILTIIGYSFKTEDILRSVPGWLLGTFLLVLYFSEYWAFLFKINADRIKEIMIRTKGRYNQKIEPFREPGFMLFYGFIIRMIFRITLILAALTMFGVETGKTLPLWAGIVMGTTVLVELFVFLYAAFETKVIINSPDEEGTKAEWESELKWREKMVRRMKLPNFQLKLECSNIVLLVAALAATYMFWNMVNREFVDFIHQSAITQESPAFVIILIPIACFVLSIFFLTPVRLAFWIEQLFQIDTKQELLKFRLSLLFAGISITAPTLIALLKYSFSL